MSDELEDLDAPGGGDQPDPQNQPDPNAAPDPAAESAALKAKIAELESFVNDPTLAELRRNPNLLHDARAAALRANEPSQQRDVQLTPDQIALQDQEANAQFMQNPARYTAQAALAAARKAQQESQGPIQEHLAGLTIANFKAQKEANDPDFKFAKAGFEAIEDQLLKGIAGQPVAVQNRFLENQYFAEIGKRYLARERKPAPGKGREAAPNLGRGGGAPTGGKPEATEIDELALAEYKRMGYSDEDATALLKYAEESDVNVKF